MLVAGKEIFATHYSDAALGLTMIVRDPATDTSYLIYLNRSCLDLLRGTFAWIVRGASSGASLAKPLSSSGGSVPRIEAGPPPDGFD